MAEQRVQRRLVAMLAAEPAASCTKNHSSADRLLSSQPEGH